MTSLSPAAPSTSAADALVLAGLEAHRAGRLADAQGLYDLALAAVPRHADALNLSGAIAFAAGRTDDAIRLMTKAVRAKPDHVDAHLNLAEACEVAGRRPEAIAACHAVLAAAPDSSDAHARLAILTAADGDSPRALAHARVALALSPGLNEALCGQAMALVAGRRMVEAEAAYRQVLASDLDDLRTLTGLAALLRDTEAVAEAQALYRRALALRPRDPALMASLAALVEIDGDAAEARDLFEAALAIDPAAVEVRFAYARCLRDTGAFATAVTEFREVLRRRPTYGPALLALVRLRELTDTGAQRRQLSRLMDDTGLPPRHRVQAGFAAGELLDTAGEADAAFAHFTAANGLYRTHRAANGERFDRVDLLAQIGLIETTLAADYARCAATWGDPTALPVFIVGLPRSGTTLVEQICASHSQVAGLGELRSIQNIARTLATHNSGRDRLTEWDADFARHAGARHTAMLTGRAGGAVRAIDKNPHNLMRLGMIAALFPNARVIRCRRDPRDVAVSNHTLFFGHGNLYSTDQTDCAFAVREIDRLGSIWQRNLDLQMLDVVYEDLVGDLDGQVRRIIEFLDVPWEAQCLQFHQTTRYVDTPSSWQVRQPVYATSIGRWRRFEKHLGPMLAELGPAPARGSESGTAQCP